MTNRVLMDRARNRKGQYMRDGFKGPGPDRNRFHNQYQPMDYGKPYPGNDYTGGSYGSMPDNRMADQHYREPYRANEYQGYAQGVVSYYPAHPDFASQDYHMEDEEYKKELHQWIEKLKAKDTFRVSKEQIIRQAKSMGVNFNKYSEDEFYAVYLMHLSDYPGLMSDYISYIKMAKFWLDDDDVEYRGTEKLCGYLTHIVIGE